jgi:hypothetical protein
MAESSTSVRLVKHHLRQAGALLAARELDSAAAHVDAALAIDPDALPALTLRDRLQNMRAGTADTPASSPQQPSSGGRFVPVGVDVGSWLDFEQRVQERRFRALVEGTERAIIAGDRPAASAALDEARALRPDSVDVARLSARLATLPAPRWESTRIDSFLHSRAFRAASILIFGGTVLMGVDWLRSESPIEQTASNRSDRTNIAADPSAVALATTPAASAPTVATSGDTGNSTADRTQFRSVTEAPRDPAAPLAETTAPATNREPLRPAVETRDDVVALALPGAPPASPAAAPVLRGGEIPDDYVSPARAATARETAPTPPVASTTPAPRVVIPLASPVRQPSSVVESLIPPVVTSAPPISAPPVSSAANASAPPAAAATVAAAAVTASVPSDRNQVNSVLQQYARAHSQLDANAVRAVWPSVDQRALSKAFSNLSSQTVSFDDCSIDVNGASAHASCRGKATYVGKVGSQERRTESRTVTFDLKRDGEGWEIQKAETRR